MTPEDAKLAEVLLQNHRSTQRLRVLTAELRGYAAFLEGLAAAFKEAPESVLSPSGICPQLTGYLKVDELDGIIREIAQLKTDIALSTKAIADLS
jgi:hypothetical protein